MTKNKNSKLLSFVRWIFFEVVSPKFKIAKLKFLMDFSYVLFEKIALSFEFLYSNYFELYDELVEKEVKIAKATSEDKILVIGSGSLPSTPIQIVKKTGAKVIGIDIDSTAIKNSNKLIKNLGLQNLINFQLADGVKFSYKDYDVIFLLYGIKKQKDILENLSDKIGDKTRIIYRTTQDVLENTLGGKEFLSKYFKVSEYVDSDMLYLARSYLLTKKK